MTSLVLPEILQTQHPSCPTQRSPSLCPRTRPSPQGPSRLQRRHRADVICLWSRRTLALFSVISECLLAAMEKYFQTAGAQFELTWGHINLFYHVLRNVFFHIQIYLFDIFYWHPEWWKSLTRIPKRSKVKLGQTQMWTAAWRVGDAILTFLLQHGKILRPLCSLLRYLDKHQQQ